MFGNLPALGFAQSPCLGIHVKILNIRNSTVTVDCALFASSDGFPREFLHSAIVVNGKLDTNWLGVPKEGYAFSNDVKAVRGAPSFSDASFPYDGQELNFTLSLRYEAAVQRRKEE
jgi:uncharacterized protein (DUF2141 family)